jgi:hypothetical protein
VIRQSQVVDPGPVPGTAFPGGPPGATATLDPEAVTAVHRRMRWPAVVTTLLVVVTAAACTNNISNASPPSTFVANSPWLGTFATVDVPAPVNTLSGLDCVSAKKCWAIGSTVGGDDGANAAALIGTVNGGATWAAEAIPPTVGYLSGIACTDTIHCTAVGQAAGPTGTQAVAIMTLDGGVRWGPVVIPPSVVDLTAITCEHDGRCMAVGTTPMGSVALVSMSSGATWTQGGSLPAAMSGATAVSCTADGSCWVTGHTVTDLNHVTGILALSTNDGATWATVAIPTGAGNLTGLSCLTGSPTGVGAFPTPPTTTTAPLPATATTTTAHLPGSTKVSATTSTSISTTTTVAPPTTTTVPPVGVPGVRCTVVGTTATTLDAARVGHGLMFTTDNGGATWSSQALDATSASLNDVSCAAVGACVAVGSSVATVPQAGVVLVSGSRSSPWRRPAWVGFPQPLTAVSCVSVTHCVAVGESILVHLVGG